MEILIKDDNAKLPYLHSDWRRKSRGAEIDDAKIGLWGAWKAGAERMNFMLIMAIRVVEFSNGGTKLERFLPRNYWILRIGLMGRCQKV